MGYFNIFYKITRVIDMLTRKRNRRFIIIFLMVIGIIFILHNKGYCAQEDSAYTTDTDYFIIENYNSSLNDLVECFDKNYGTNQNITNYFNTFFEDIQSGYYPYLYLPNLNYQWINVFMYNFSNDKTLVNTSLVYNDYLRVPSTAYNVTIPTGVRLYVVNKESKRFDYRNTNNVSNVAVPSILLYRIPTQIIDIMERAGYGYNGTKDALIDIKALLNQIDTNTQIANNKLDGINDSLTNSTYNEEIVDVDTSAIDNVPEQQINGLFTSVIGAFQNSLSSYSGTITKIIPLPHGRTNRDSKQYCINSFGKSYCSC